MEIKCFDCNFEEQTGKPISLVNKVDYVTAASINEKVKEL
jgi:hypothetical protein